jgi:hypothetical protein
MLINLRAVGRDLRKVGDYARFTLCKQTRTAAAEVICHRRVLSDPKTLTAAKAVWPDLATVQ